MSRQIEASGNKSIMNGSKNYNCALHNREVESLWSKIYKVDSDKLQ